MGVNNRQRRAAKQRKRERRRHSQGAGSSRPSGWRDNEDGRDEHAVRSAVELRISTAVGRLGWRTYDEAVLLREAENVLRQLTPQPHHVAEDVLANLLARLTTRVSDGGWDRADLEQLVRRNSADRHLPTLFAALGDDRLRLDSTGRFASALQVAALLSTAPLMDADAIRDWCGGRGGGDGGRGSHESHPKLAQVRALLAKAESTDFDEEAEALSAKAQELITRYALEQFVDTGADGPRRDGRDVRVRRIWLDSPYLRAKASLVHEVADANRCRSARDTRLGFCLVVGSRADLDAVELLVTSLLVQADRAMLRHGQRVDGVGRSRTRSFRQSFLVAYAVRIGERLRAAAAAATDDMAETERDRLLPVLHDHEETVSEAFDAMVPHSVGRATSVTNGEGWAAGVAAADLAQLDVNGKLTEHAG